MFAKLAVLIVAFALTASALLAARQLRTQTAHELAQARLRVMRLDNERWKLRAQIAGLITPEHVTEMASRNTPLKPLAGEFPVPVVASGGRR
jgi:multidrug resistance efflux pump